jgi:hypothetical protein
VIKVEIGKFLAISPMVRFTAYQRDHFGKILWLTVPNSHLSDTVGHVFLDMVSAFGGVLSVIRSLSFTNPPN